jgi:hypothetical protein
VKDKYARVAPRFTRVGTVTCRHSVTSPEQRGRRRYRREAESNEEDAFVAAVKRTFSGTVELRPPQPRRCPHWFGRRRATPDYPNIYMCDRCWGKLTLARWHRYERHGGSP